MVKSELSKDEHKFKEDCDAEHRFLAKYIGNYEINKIGNKFLIRNGERAVVIEKDRW